MPQSVYPNIPMYREKYPRRQESSKFQLCLEVIGRSVEHSFVIVTACYNEAGL